MAPQPGHNGGGEAVACAVMALLSCVFCKAETDSV